MDTKRVLIVNIQTVLIVAVESLLKNSGNFAVINSYPEDIFALICEIEQTRPDVVVMDEGTYFANPMNLFISLWEIPNIRLIVLNNRRNFIDVFDKQEFAIANPNQLIDVIQADKAITSAE